MANDAEGCGGSLVAAVLIGYILMPVLAINAMNSWGDREVRENGEIAILVWALISLIISIFLFMICASDNKEKNEKLKALKEKLDNAKRERESLRSTNSSSFEQKSLQKKFKL